jgi:hypothetical protein
MHSGRSGRSRRRQRGLAAVEMTLVTPLLLLLMFATAELGRVLIQYNTLTKAVRDGVRHAATHALTGSTGVVLLEGALVEEIRNLVVYGNPTGAGSPLLEGLATGDVEVSNAFADEVTVSASHAYAPLWGGSIPTFGIGSSDLSIDLTLRASATMRGL